MNPLEHTAPPADWMAFAADNARREFQPPAPIYRPRRKRYRLIVDLEVDLTKLRAGENARRWPALIIRQHLSVALRMLTGYRRATITWRPGQESEGL